MQPPGQMCHASHAHPQFSKGGKKSLYVTWWREFDSPDLDYEYENWKKISNRKRSTNKFHCMIYFPLRFMGMLYSQKTMWEENCTIWILESDMASKGLNYILLMWFNSICPGLTYI